MAATVGEVVARRIGEARAGAYSLRDLSARLGDLGVDLNPNALSRIERGEREVKVEEFVQIAMALNVAPASLLVGEWDEPIAVTEAIEIGGGQLWWWIVGQEPIDGDEDRYRDNSRTEMFERYETVLRRQAERRAALDLIDLARRNGNEELVARASEMLGEAEERYAEAVRLMDEDLVIPMLDDVPARQDAERS